MGGGALAHFQRVDPVFFRLGLRLVVFGCFGLPISTTIETKEKIFGVHKENKSLAHLWRLHPARAVLRDEPVLSLIMTHDTHHFFLVGYKTKKKRRNDNICVCYIIHNIACMPQTTAAIFITKCVSYTLRFVVFYRSISRDIYIQYTQE